MQKSLREGEGRWEKGEREREKKRENKNFTDKE